MLAKEAVRTFISKYFEAYVQSNQMVDYGYCSADTFEEARSPYLMKAEKEYLCEFEVRDQVEDLVDPSRTYEKSKSILVIALPYGVTRPDENEVAMVDEELVGNMAAGTNTFDYHVLVHDLLEPLREQLLEAYGIAGKVVVDTSPLSDRSMAVRAGLGIIRRNSMCYHKKFGSYFYIGGILLDADLSQGDKRPLGDPCGNCRRCVEFCPNGAIVGDYAINSRKCVSYLTQKKVLTEDESIAIGRQIYGCDVCQLVCPANRGVKNPSQEPLVPLRVEVGGLLKISNKDFKSSYKRTDSGWRGKRTLQRNGIAVLGNYNKLIDLGPDMVAKIKKILNEYTNDERAVIMDEAMRAIDRLDHHRK